MSREWLSVMTDRILLVEEDPEQLRQMRVALAGSGREVVSATALAAAQHLLATQRFAGVVLGAQVLGVEHFELIQLTAGLEPAPAVVVCAVQDAAEVVALCYRAGAAGYLVKPVEAGALRDLLERVLAERAARLERADTNQALRLELEERMAELERERARLCDLSACTLEALVTALEAKDEFMAGHSARVAELAASMATALGYSDDEVESVRLAGRLHDLGMIAVSAAILNKQGPLSPEEYAQVKQHPEVGYRLLAPFEHLQQIARFVRGHHERWDGHGYPDGLAGDAIPWGARILAAAETYDALVSARPYRDPTSSERAAEIVGELAGQALDPEICAALISVVRRRQTLEFLRPDGELLVESAPEV